MCEEVSEKYRAQFKSLWQSLGFSCDWDSAYSTISESSQRISQRSFLDLLEKNLVEFKEMPTLWCCKCHTSFAQAEIDAVKKGTIFNYLNFKSETGENIPIATTRPELLPGCVSMFIHPENKKQRRSRKKKSARLLFCEIVAVFCVTGLEPRISMKIFPIQIHRAIIMTPKVFLDRYLSVFEPLKASFL